jgi:MarR family transcriptional regulator, exopolysaccharide II synthesis transcriptional activator
LSDLTAAFLATIAAIERANRIYSVIIGKEVYRLGVSNMSNSEAIVLMSVGNSKIALGKLRNRVSYSESHVNSIVRRLIQNGHLLHERSGNDRRAIRVWLSAKGSHLCDRLIQFHKRMDPKATSNPGMKRTVRTLRRIEDLLIDQRLDS